MGGGRGWEDAGPTSWCMPYQLVHAPLNLASN